VSSHSLLLWRFSYLPLCGRRCFRDEGACDSRTDVIPTSGARKAKK
jgi:hypothetical protein